MRWRAWILMLALAGPAARARADQPAPPPPATTAPKPVRVGPTTVTVIDEQESVDDIISRVRRARQERAAKAVPPPAIQPIEQPPREKIKAKLRDARDRDKLSRKEARERAQRLRENLRERRANRLKRAE